MAAFALAIQMGVKHIELDVHSTIDGHIVVIHDETVNRTTNGSGGVRSHPLAAVEVGGMPMGIEAVLFDADGVLQRPAVRWGQAFELLLGPGHAGGIDEFMRDVVAVELPALTVSVGFEDALALVLDRWNCSARLAEALQMLTAIEVYDDVMGAVQWLRRSGVACHLATNQQAHRARHMSEVMEYRRQFDREFYSCYMGVAKPAVEYFAAILRELDLPGQSVLLLDDRGENVTAARQAGLVAAVYNGADGVSALRRVLFEFGLEVKECDTHSIPPPGP